MAIIPSDIEYILEEETDVDSPLSEQLLQKIGATLNGLVDLLANFQFFSGSAGFQIPENVEKVYCLIWGGGGGGAGGNGGGTLAGGGGAGAVPQFHPLKTNPLDNYTATIGTGGAFGGVNSAGGNGTLSSFTSNLTGFGPRAFGAKGGTLASAMHTGGNGLASEATLTAALVNEATNATPFPSYTKRDHFTYGGSGSSANSVTGQAGQDSPYASGGAGGVGSDTGGGGGAGFGTGGSGSSTTSGTATSAAANSGAGGGGGGGNKAGGNGGSGGAYLFY